MQPCAKIRTQYDTKSSRNHAVSEVNFPERNAFCVGASVMLLSNFVVEHGLFNGSVGEVREIVYDTPEGPRTKGALPSYVVVDFPGCTVPADKAWDPNHPTHIPIPVVERMCEKKCCKARSVPLRVCKAITIHKSQGMTVGEKELWKLLVVVMPEINSKPDKTPGLLQVALSRCGQLCELAIFESTTSPLTMERLLKIGTTPAYNSRRDFETRLGTVAGTTLPSAMEILEPYCDPADPTNLDKTWTNLCNWYKFESQRLFP